jgi:hypothetical protein
MIKLKNGLQIDYVEDIDIFLENIYKSVINEAYKSVKKSNLNNLTSEENDTILKEIMDNSIYIIHQLFNLAKENENLAKFLTTGFLFNSIILTIPKILKTPKSDATNDIVH